MMGGPRPIRRGTSKAVPVVVSAGLAVGVFCGLLFGLGTGEVEAQPDTSPTEKKVQEAKVSEVPEPFQPKAPSDTPSSVGTVAQAGSGSAAPAAGSGAGSGSAVAQAGSGSAAPGAGSGSAEPAIKTTKLIIEIKPDAAAAIAKITVDGKETPATSDVELGDAAKKTVTIVVKAAGYKDITHVGDVEDLETKFSLEMQKKPKGTNLPRPPTGGPRPPSGGKKPGGGLIDI